MRTFSCSAKAESKAFFPPITESLNQSPITFWKGCPTWKMPETCWTKVCCFACITLFLSNTHIKTIFAFFFFNFFFNPHSIDVRSKPHTLFHSLQFWIWNQGNFDKYNRNKLVVCGTLVVHYGVAHGPDFVVSMSNSPVEFLELAAEEVKCFISVRNDYADWQCTATST